MLSVSIGPLALPVAPLIGMLSVWVATSVAGRLAAKDDRSSAENTLWGAILVGLLAARAAYVFQYHLAYAATPWAALDLRDGGWFAPAGLVVGGVWLLWRVWQKPALRRPVGLAVVAGAVLWSAAMGAVIWADRGVEVQAGVPDVVLIDSLTGQQRSLAAVLSGQPAVVNLWASWCGPCRVEMPDLAAAQQNNPDVQFVFVNQGESAQVIKAYLQRSGLNLQHVWIDTNRALGPAVGSKGLPTTLFFDAKGKRVDAHFGVINPAALRARLQDLRNAP
ncbi:TlpA disulfide reductase family protein [Rhodoferax sp.]|uniref:TlpA disulfide reductase family protein n=1 Tax=Rhodoferax sp. TaxID=50421 RepID=UPI0028489910|nr:TlpA disulfide reductase family protein [Rhodoferax sp.]MDR3367891.1 TlpA disulfide reductase family protein [Rhodoferax sp.]